MRQYDAIVIGGGISGATILDALARRGLTRTLLVDRESFAGGATGASGAMIRVYDRDPFLSRLCLTGLQAYGKLPIGLVRTGSLYFETPARVPDLGGRVRALNALGARLELVLPLEGRERFPAFDWSKAPAAIFEEDAGYANPRKVTLFFLERAQVLGAELLSNTEVDRLLRWNGRVVGVETSRGSFAAPLVILAAGSRSLPLLFQAGVTVPVRTKALQVNAFRSSALPLCSPAFFDLNTRTFGRPSEPGLWLAGCAIEEWDRDPRLPLSPKPSDAWRAQRLASECLPALRGAEIAGATRALDAYTSDRRGLIRFLPELPGLFLALGWSGGGFKLAPAIAEQVADMISQRLEKGKQVANG